MATDRNAGQPRLAEVREAVEADLSAVADVYRDCFERSGRARLGVRTTRRYIEGVSRRRAYRLLVAREEDELSGFAVLVVSNKGLLTRTWLLRSPGVWLEIAALSLRRPDLAFASLARALRMRSSDAGAKGGPTSDAGRFAGRRAAWIELIGVKPAHRGKGLGSRFLAAIVDIARDTGFECVKLNVDRDNTGAWRFYEREGFVRTAESEREFTYAKDCL